MEREFLLKTIFALYKVTEFLPADEPLRFAIREKAIDILADGLQEEQKKQTNQHLLDNIEVIQAYFQLAQEQDWLNPANFAILKQEYNKIKAELTAKSAVSKPKSPTTVKPAVVGYSPALAAPGALKQRNRKIMQILQQRETAQMRDIKEFFPEVTKRTLRRDVDELLKQGLIERMGDKTSAVYKLR